jgi:transposase
METLEQFIESNPNPRELKRAFAVQMSQQSYSNRAIRDVLQVSLGFVTACCQRYQEHKVEGLKLNYWGTQGYLKRNQKEALMGWLAQKDAWLLEEVVEHIEATYGVVYQSPQSYYTLLKQARFSWKKSHSTHPDKAETQVEEKKLKSWNYWCSGQPQSLLAASK